MGVAIDTDYHYHFRGEEEDWTINLEWFGASIKTI